MRRLTFSAGTLLIVVALAAPAGASTGSDSPQRARAAVSHPGAQVSHHATTGKQVAAGAEARITSGWRDTNTRIFLKPGTVWHG
jgi:hypothetical protein